MKTIQAVVLTIALTTAASAPAANADTPAPADYGSIFDCVSKPKAQSTAPAGKLTRFALDAVSPNPTVAQHAIAALRGNGPDGLRALLDTHAEILKQHDTPSLFVAAKVPDESWTRLKTALDAVGQQRDCYASKLFWWTDLEQAKSAARESGKPILSLRLLGKLDEEFSCANSRFFRTTLYANAEVAKYLNDHFVLHWKSVRPVPRVTIDFGDGRKLERTITGNSIHYVLDADGRVIDALPGLYGPQAFLTGLGRAETVANQCNSLTGEPREQRLRAFHQERAAALRAGLAADLQQINSSHVTREESDVATPVVNITPAAQAAGRLAVGKGRVEMPILRPALPETKPNQTAQYAMLDDATWAGIAALHADTARLDVGTKALIRAKNPTAFDASRLALSKAFVEDPLLRQIRVLERSISEDTVRNEYVFHAKLHEWLATGPAANADVLNARVYTELFLTPDSDPWLGLVPADTFSALDHGGLVQTPAKP